MLLFLLGRLQWSGCPCAGSGRCTAACGGGGLQPGLVPLPQERLVINLVPIVLTRNGRESGFQNQEAMDCVYIRHILHCYNSRSAHLTVGHNL